MNGATAVTAGQVIVVPQYRKLGAQDLLFLRPACGVKKTAGPCEDAALTECGSIKRWRYSPTVHFLPGERKADRHCNVSSVVVMPKSSWAELLLLIRRWAFERSLQRHIEALQERLRRDLLELIAVQSFFPHTQNVHIARVSLVMSVWKLSE